jgi:hypothetical protein
MCLGAFEAIIIARTRERFFERCAASRALVFCRHRFLPARVIRLAR